MREVQRREIAEKLETMAVPMDRIEYTRANYDMLFPNGVVKTPLGEVKLGEHQFDKLQVRGRPELLGALKQTLQDPIFIILSDNVELFTKSFVEDKTVKSVISIIIKRDGQRISISTHRRGLSNVVNKIKKDKILYEKDLALEDGRVHASKKRDSTSAEAIPNTGSGGGSLKTGDQNQPYSVSPN